MKNIRVEQTEKAASKTGTERGANLRLNAHRRVVQRQPLHRTLQLLVVIPGRRKEPLEHHRLGLTKRVQRRQFHSVVERLLVITLQHQRVANLRGAHVPLAGYDVPDAPGGQFRHFQRLRGHQTELEDLGDGSRSHRTNFIADFNGAVDDRDARHRAPVRIVVAVQEQRAQSSGRTRIPARCGHAFDDGVEHFTHVRPDLRGDGYQLGGVDAEHAL